MQFRFNFLSYAINLQDIPSLVPETTASVTNANQCAFWNERKFLVIPYR